VKFDTLQSYLGICLDCSLSYTRIHTQKESLVVRGTHQATGQCRLGNFLQSFKCLLLGSCIWSGRYSAVPHAHTKHINVSSNESMRVTTGCLRTPSETRRSSCLKLYTKALNPKHLLHETLRPSPKRLRSRKPLRSFLELLSTHGEPTTSIPPVLQSFIPAFDPQPPGFDLPRNAWVQLNLRTGIGQFAANVKLMGLCA